MSHERTKPLARNAGLSLRQDLIEKLDALNEQNIRRSEFVRELMLDGLVHRFGPNWEQIASERQDPEAA